MKSISPPNVNRNILSIKQRNLTVGQFPPTVEDKSFSAFVDVLHLSLNCGGVIPNGIANPIKEET
jgi:hypothetical protein